MEPVQRELICRCEHSFFNHADRDEDGFGRCQVPDCDCDEFWEIEDYLTGGDDDDYDDCPGFEPMFLL